MRKKFLSLLVLVLLTLSYSVKSQKYTFTEIKTDSIKRDFKKILIVSFGSVEARSFCENLSEQLIKTLMADSIEVEFKYLGKDAAAGNKEFKILAIQKYDAIISLVPKDSASYWTNNNTTSTQSSNNAIGQMPMTTRFRDVTYTQTFNIQLLEPVNQSKVLWSASLYVIFDPAKKKVYKEITKTILSSFRKSKLIK